MRVMEATGKVAGEKWVKHIEVEWRKTVTDGGGGGSR